MPRTGKQPAKPAASASGPKKFVFKPRSPGRTPPKSNERISRIWLHKARYSKDCDYGKKGELTGNKYVRALPSRREWNEPMKGGVSKWLLGEMVRWQQEMRCWLMRVHSQAQLPMLLDEFKAVCTDCHQTEVEGADEWDPPKPKITFNIVKEVKFGDEIRSAILAEGDTYHMKEVALKPNDFKFENELGMWARFYEGEPPALDETELKRYGWEFDYQEFDEAASED